MNSHNLNDNFKHINKLICNINKNIFLIVTGYVLYISKNNESCQPIELRLTVQ